MRTVDYRKTKYATTTQQVIAGFLQESRFSHTPREIILRTGLDVSPVTVKDVLSKMLREGIVTRRKRIFGFDAGIFEYRAAKKSAQSRLNHHAARSQQVIGFEPLHKKLKRLLGVKRARETEPIVQP